MWAYARKIYSVGADAYIGRLLSIYKIRMILPLQTNSLAAVQAEMLHTASMVANGRMWDSEPTGAVMIRCTIKKRTCPWLPL